MGVSVIDMIQGPATLYGAVFGATEPTDATTAPVAAWVDLGGTLDGVAVEITQNYSQMKVDQIVDVPESRLTERMFVVKTNLAEGTLSNLKFALNGGLLTSVAPTATFEPTQPDSGTRPDYAAIMLDGSGQGGKTRRFIGRKMLSTDGVKFKYEKDGQQVFEVSLLGHYVTSTLRPFRVMNAL